MGSVPSTVFSPASTAPVAPSVRDRLLPAVTRLPRYWWVPLALVTLLGGVLRFAHLSWPHAVVFDETYYLKDAYSLSSSSCWTATTGDAACSPAAPAASWARGWACGGGGSPRAWRAVRPRP